MKKLLFENETIFILAEIAQSYEGEINVLLDIVDGLSIAKVNGIMFQVVYADELAVPNYDYHDLFKSLEMKNNDWKKVINKIQSKNICAVAEIFGRKSFDLMIKNNINAVKIHASDITNEPLLKYIGNHNVSVLLAVGGANENEISRALNLLEIKKKEIILMHGYQKGPTPIRDTHFYKIFSLLEKYNLPVGYSDHIAGFSGSNYKKINNLANYFPFIAIGAGSRLIEKHVILNRKKQWEDYESALTTKEFEIFVELIRTVENSTGMKTLECNETEKNYRRAIKSIVAKKDIVKGSIILDDDIAFKRVNENIKSIKNINEVIDHIANHNIRENEAITKESIKSISK